MALRQALHDRGMHATAQREAVYEVVLSCPGHICAEHILSVAGARWPELGINKTTVYRALDALQQLGLVNEHRCGNGPAQYEAASRGHHVHLLCRACGHLQVLDADLVAALRGGLRNRYGFEAEMEDHPIIGICAGCRAMQNG